MTPEEFKIKIAESTNPSWFNNINTTLNFNLINYNPNFTSVSAMYEFACKQLEGWQKIPKTVNQEILNNSKPRFETLKAQLEQFINRATTTEESQFKSQWQNVVNQISSLFTNAFKYDSPELLFLIDINEKAPNNFQGAYDYIKGTTQTIQNKHYFEGAMLAYEFYNKNGSPLSERISKENESLTKLKEEFNEYLGRTETQLTTNLSEASIKVKTFVEESIDYKNKKESEVNTWLKNSQEAVNNFNTESTNKIKDLEKTYEELLRLKKPAEYWEKRAEKLKSEGRNAMRWLIALIVLGGICIYFLLWLTPEGMLKSFFGDDKTSALRWSIVFITFISLIFVGIKVLSKVMFSSFHLARDAEERQQLTHVYLALIKDAAIDPKDKQLVMQSLFSRADTGLLKEDSAPTMPNGMDKFIKTN